MLTKRTVLERGVWGKGREGKEEGEGEGEMEREREEEGEGEGCVFIIKRINGQLFVFLQ